LDEFKTQVLLLHSEQSTLDNLSSGFSDRYTVHCATSGSEALNTLVATPINVIITAHDLPGMSGLDALREAKKRSPDTIGILLAGNATRDIQALVGTEEVFQVVSGQITSDGLLQLVDKATRQMRLMALAHSANDMTAGVDEPAEHIIMETSENGSTIISDGTGRLPVLDLKKVAASAAVGSRSVDVLVLTKDQEFLETIKDSSRGMHKVYYANTLGQANEAISKHKIGVAVVDAAMVGERIEQLTQHLRKGSPRLVSIVAGRRDDGEMLMDLINRGKVYRFLLKPVSPGRARLAVEASVKHHLEAPDAAFKMIGTTRPPVRRLPPRQSQRLKQRR
jgi:DNA-binding NtrC family response regulator